MRRIIALLLGICLMVPFTSALALTYQVNRQQLTDGETLLRGYEKGTGYQYVQFGSYPYEKDGTVAPSLWRVLAIENNYAFLLNEYVVDAERFHHEKVDQPEWKDYEIFGYMNGTMVPKMFTPAEQGALKYTEEMGRLFILDNREFMTGAYGFRQIMTEVQWERECEPTPWAVANRKAYIHPPNGKSWYWSRTCRHTAAGGYEYMFGYNGHISMAGFLRIGGIRPACYVDLTMLDHATGSGTKADPYVFGHIGPAQSTQVTATDAAPAGPAPSPAPASTAIPLPVQQPTVEPVRQNP